MREQELPEARQVAALCWRQGDAGRDTGREVLLITSSHGRWILPKGWPMEGKSDAEAAAIEAWEEAGVVRGDLSDPIGQFVAVKQGRSGHELRLPTQVFPYLVTELADDWPERHRRERRWLPLAEAAATVTEPDLAALLRGF